MTCVSGLGMRDEAIHRVQRLGCEACQPAEVRDSHEGRFATAIPRNTDHAVHLRWMIGKGQSAETVARALDGQRARVEVP